MPAIAKNSWDVIVVGVGAVGSAALYQLARRGVKVLGIDRFAPPHDRGSSHGETRITRLALGEGAEYFQFARRSHEIWRELEAATGRTLLRQVGGLVFGRADACGATHGADDFLRTTIEVARAHELSHEVLEGEELRRRFPQFNWRGDERGCLEHGAGYVHPEECIAAQMEMARRHGAEVQTGERVLGWRASGEGVEVETERGRFTTGRLILSAGAWNPGMAPLTPARVYRQVLFWFEPNGSIAEFTPERMPVFIRLPESGAEMFYGFPAINGTRGGMKIAAEQFEQTTDSDAMATEVTREEERRMQAIAAPYLRISERCVRAVACKYTVMPGSRFVIDRHPESERVWVASACSGHGFKHSAAVGEALAEMAGEGRTGYDLSAFGLR